MTGCEEFELLLSAQLDGQLSPLELRALEEHLAQCPSCRALQAELRLLQEETRTLAAPLPDDLFASILDQVADQPQDEVPAPIPLPTKRRWGHYLAGAAVLALVVVGAVAGDMLPFGAPTSQEATLAAPMDTDGAGKVSPGCEKWRIAPPPQEGAPTQEDAPALSQDADSDSAASPQAGADGGMGRSVPPPASEPPQAALDSDASANTPPTDADTAPATAAPYAFSTGEAAPAEGITRQEAEEALAAYLAETGRTCTTTDYLGVAIDMEGYLFGLVTDQGDVCTFWVSRADGTVSPVEGVPYTPQTP